MTTIESPSGFTKEIKYDPESKDYMMLLDGELRGYARSYHEAEVTLDKLVYDLLAADLHRSASELDGGAICPACGDALTGDEPRCAACRESEPLTLPRAVALAVGGADVCAACRCTNPALPGGEFCAYHAHYAYTTPFALGG